MPRAPPSLCAVCVWASLIPPFLGIEKKRSVFRPPPPPPPPCGQESYLAPEEEEEEEEEAVIPVSEEKEEEVYLSFRQWAHIPRTGAGIHRCVWNVMEVVRPGKSQAGFGFLPAIKFFFKPKIRSFLTSAMTLRHRI